MTGPEALFAFAAAAIIALLVPRSSTHRRFVFLLLTGVGVLLGVGLSLGAVGRIFN
jgi:hypothetical protein